MVFHADISTKTSDWGSFGGYFGGMISIISIVLLYYTFTEQRRANYRNSFDNAYKRLLESYMVNIKDNNNYFDNVFEGICLNAKQAVSALSAESTPWEKLNIIWNKIKKKYKQNPKYLDAYCSFLHIVQRIAFDNNLDFPTKKLYLHDFEHSLPIPILLSILLKLCSKKGENEDLAIELLKKFEMFRDLQVETTIDDAKNQLLGYAKKNKPNFLLMLIEDVKAQI